MPFMLLSQGRKPLVMALTALIRKPKLKRAVKPTKKSKIRFCAAEL